MEYRFTNTQPLVYADRSIVVEPGDILDWPDGPPADGHWSPTDETLAELDRIAQSTSDQQTSGTPPEGDVDVSAADPKPTETPAARVRTTKE